MTQDENAADPGSGAHRRGPSPALPPTRSGLERLGLLAGGVAHDFNNLLNVILGSIELACSHLPPNGPAKAELEQAKLASRQAGLLAAQLLQAARPREVIEVDANEVLEAARTLLTRSVGASIQLEIDAAPAIWPVRAVPAELWQMVLNLTANARDAMPTGGRLVIRTRNHTLAKPPRTEFGALAAGDYVGIEVADCGCGMTAATRARLFEPFFTTKGNAGTGLGLATVARIVGESEGGIRIHSEPGAGTTVEVLLPRASATAHRQQP